MAITYHDLYLNTCKAMGAMGIEANRLEARELICAASGKSPEKLLQDLNLYTTDEIARILGQRPGTVRSHLSRARETLRRVLKGELEL